MNSKKKELNMEFKILFVVVSLSAVQAHNFYGGSHHTSNYGLRGLKPLWWWNRQFPKWISHVQVTPPLRYPWQPLYSEGIQLVDTGLAAVQAQNFQSGNGGSHHTNENNFRGPRCLTENTTFYGNNLVMGTDNPQPSIRHCQKSCASNPDCSLWTWGKLGWRHAYRCYLKTEKSDDKREMPEHVTGDKHCNPKRYIEPTNAENKNNDCLRYGEYTYGNFFVDGTENILKSIFDCQQQCADNPRCLHYTWGVLTSDNAGECYLKDKESDDVRQDDDLIQGIKYCRPPPNYSVKK